MKTSTHFFLLKWAPLLLLFVFVDQACKKSDHNPDQNNARYIGTWLDMRSVNEGEANVELNNILTLSADSLTYFAQYGITSLGPWFGLFKLNGSVADSAGTVLKVNVTAISVPKYDANDHISGYTVYKSNDPEFLHLLSQYNFEQSFNFMYNISGNKMTLKRDFNNDGNFSDVNETIVYTRQWIWVTIQEAPPFLRVKPFFPHEMKLFVCEMGFIAWELESFAYEMSFIAWELESFAYEMSFIACEMKSVACEMGFMACEMGSFACELKLFVCEMKVIAHEK